MTVEVIGNRMIKQLKYGRTMVTEQVGNVTLTKVFSGDGTELVSRAKKVEKEQIGDKFVTTRTDVKKVNEYKNDPEKCMSYGFKTILSRVLDKDGKYLGAKLTEFRPRQSSILSGNDPLKGINKGVRFETKIGADTFVSFSKQFGIIDNGVVTHKKANMGSRFGELKPQYRSSIKAPDSEERIEIGRAPKEWAEFFNDLNTRTHNKKGLPLPTKLENANTELLDYDKMSNMSLKDMRQHWFNQTDGATDYSRAMNLNQLNEVKDMTMTQIKDTSAPINDLTKYL